MIRIAFGGRFRRFLAPAAVATAGAVLVSTLQIAGPEHFLTPSSAASSSHLTSRTAMLRKDVLAKWGCKQKKRKTHCIKSVGGYRAGDPQDHGKGKALDLMLSGTKAATGEQRELGDEITAWIRKPENIKKYHLSYVIWQDRIWNVSRDRASSKGRINCHCWNNVTQAHRNHVHISLK